MKHLLYLLVVVNLVYFSWHMLQGNSPDGAVRELPPLPSNTRRLMTLQELQDRREAQKPAGISVTQPSSRTANPAKAGPLAGIEALTELEPPGTGVLLSCLTVGPFLSEVELKAAADRIDTLELASSQRVVEEARQIGYWIFLPAMPREEALGYKAILDRNKDKEYFIGKENVLSLGAFKQKSRASRRLKELQKIGIDAVLEPRYKTHDVFWLDLAGDISASDRDRLATVMSGVGVEVRTCR